MKEFPWYGYYVVCLVLTSFAGERYYHPVAWFVRYREAQRLYDSFMLSYYRGKLPDLDSVPVIVDYTGLRDNHLPTTYNDIPIEGDLSSLNFEL